MRPGSPPIEQLIFRALIALGILMPQLLGEPNCAPAWWLAGRIMKSTVKNEET
jgi:hypothetical protein